MSDRHETFTVGERFRIEATTSAGDIVVRPGPPDQVVVRVTGGGADDYRISQHGDTITAAPERGAGRRRFNTTDIDLDIPPGGSVELVTASGDVLVQAAVVDLDVVSASGDVKAGSIAGNARARSAAGVVTIDEVGGRLSVVTASGEIRVGRVDGDLEANTASGDMEVGWCGQDVDVRTASGDLTVRHLDGADATITTISGDVRLGIPPRRTLDVELSTLSGDVRNRLPAGDGSPPEKRVTLKAKTLSGDITLQGI